MRKVYFNKRDFSVQLSEPQLRELEEKRASFSAMGERIEYDVFLSHSTKDAALIKQIRDVLEFQFGISVYIDWEEDAGTPRDEIADAVKNAMDRSRSFLVVKTDNSDDSSWVSWETGYFDNKDEDKIGVLLVEDDENEFNSETFKHQEYLKNYIILEKQDVVDFIEHGSLFIKKKSIKPIRAIPPVVKPKKMVRPHGN